MIEAYYHQDISISTISTFLKRSRTPIHYVVNILKEGHSALDYYKWYKKKISGSADIRLSCRRNNRSLSRGKSHKAGTPDVIVGRKEKPISCSMRTLYRHFKERVFDETTLPMKGKWKTKGHQERRGKQAFKWNIAESETDYPAFKEEFGHIECDMIVGVRRKSAIITLSELLSNAITTRSERTNQRFDAYRWVTEEDGFQSARSNIRLFYR